MCVTHLRAAGLYGPTCSDFPFVVLALARATEPCDLGRVLARCVPPTPLPTALPRQLLAPSTPACLDAEAPTPPTPPLLLLVL